MAINQQSRRAAPVTQQAKQLSSKYFTSRQSKKKKRSKLKSCAAELPAARLFGVASGPDRGNGLGNQATNATAGVCERVLQCTRISFPRQPLGVVMD
jgi:hypothetical protein